MRTGLILLAAALLYVPAAGLGYGADDDAYRVLRSGRHWLRTGEYQASRNPGYPVVEGAVGVLDAAGGATAVNLGTLAMTLLAVGATLGVARRLGVPDPPLVASLVALHPYVWSNAAASMDHTWALGLWMAGWLALLDRRAALGGLLLGLSVGARLPTALAVGAVLAFAGWRGERRNAVVATGVAGGVAAACIAFPAAEAGWTLGFLQPAWMDDSAVWALPMWAGRWIYKSVTFWGVLPSLALAAIAVAGWRARSRVRPHLPLFVLAVGIVVVYEALYLRYPLDRAYLLPTVPVVALAAGAVLSRPFQIAFVVLVGLSSLVAIEVARPDQPFAARSADVGVWLAPGPVVEAARLRLTLRGCESVACWQARVGAARLPRRSTRAR